MYVNIPYMDPMGVSQDCSPQEFSSKSQLWDVTKKDTTYPVFSRLMFFSTGGVKIRGHVGWFSHILGREILTDLVT